MYFVTIILQLIWLQNLNYHRKTKHVNVKYNFIRHVIDGSEVALKKFHTQHNCADMFTKLVW